MQSISELEKKLEELPLLPTVVVRLLALDSNDDNYFENVLKLSQQDPTFALRVIRLSNSAANSPLNPITTLQDAVVRLGVSAVAGLVTSMSAIRIFLPKNQGEKDLWAHSIQVAVAAKFIAKISLSLKTNPEQAYLCGLLHDIGRFVLFDKAADEMDMVETADWESPSQLIDVEKKQYGFDHSELGGRVTKKWGLPEDIINVVTNHHVYKAPSDISKNSISENLTHIIQMADFFSVFILHNPDFESWAPDKVEKELNGIYLGILGPNTPKFVQQLQIQAIKIIDESRHLATGLGLGLGIGN